ncbi:hypothetical protein [Corynebacterium amycolatum]|uniref:hypothetical protein n=1 Tax=Corynebacterium amycolatum TaxID=43765 RepID=UPI00234DFFAE|nr:hypothetical protein [Corynebacterium amycolatum]MDC7116143.1 hypothetical protein [Corynebacterium amycolatum]
MTMFEVHLIDKYTGAVERSFPVETWEEAKQVAQQEMNYRDPLAFETRITEQEQQ